MRGEERTREIVRACIRERSVAREFHEIVHPPGSQGIARDDDDEDATGCCRATSPIVADRRVNLNSARKIPRRSRDTSITRRGSRFDARPDDTSDLIPERFRSTTRDINCNRARNLNCNLYLVFVSF